jgi:hypothetical protein
LLRKHIGAGLYVIEAESLEARSFLWFGYVICNESITSWLAP